MRGNLQKVLGKLLPRGASSGAIEPTDTFEIQPLVFEQDIDSWLASEPNRQGADKGELVVATLNTWFGEYFFERRLEATLELLRDSEADIIGLQEMTRESLEILSAESWVRDGYSISDADGSTFEDYGVVILSRVPIHRLEIHQLPGPMGRRVVVAELLLNGESLHVVAVHLESLRSSAPVRVAQLHDLFELLASSRHSVIMGDFNFCASWPENDHLDSAYTDVWSRVRPQEPGYTEDTDINRMRAFVTRKSKQVRFDRILLRSQNPGWVAREIELLGVDPVAPGLPLVYPSDHFGLVSRLAWQKAGATV
ncbi:MAG: endonuclease/exonuclease/phosphatase family protein [Acidobacteriota bacterium]